MTRLPVWNTVRDAHLILWRAPAEFIVLASVSVVVAPIVHTLLRWIYPTDWVYSEATLIGVQVGALSLSLAISGVTLFFIGIFAVPWHQRILEPDLSVGFRSLFRWRRPFWKYLLCGFVIGVLSNALAFVFFAIFGLAPQDLVDFVPGDGLAGRFDHLIVVTLNAVQVSVYFFLFGRWLTVFPAAALDRPLTIVGYWRATRGNGLRLATISVMCWVPFMYIRFAVQNLLYLVDEWAIEANFAFGQVWIFSIGGVSLSGIVFSVLGDYLYYVQIALVTAALSIAYRRIGIGAERPRP